MIHAAKTIEMEEKTAFAYYSCLHDFSVLCHDEKLAKKNFGVSLTEDMTPVCPCCRSTPLPMTVPGCGLDLASILSCVEFSDELLLPPIIGKKGISYFTLTLSQYNYCVPED